MPEPRAGFTALYLEAGTDRLVTETVIAANFGEAARRALDLTPEGFTLTGIAQRKTAEASGWGLIRRLRRG